MAIDVSYRDTYTTSAEDLSRFAKNFLVNEGVANNGFTVTQSGTPGMSVVVAPGTGYFYGSGTNSNVMYEFYSDANETVTIGASGVSARIDIICLKIDASTGVASIVAVAGTPSGSPAVPATPASHYKLAEVTVGAGVTTITNANITDKRSLVTTANTSGWHRLTGATLVYNAANSFSTAVGVNLTSTIQVGDKLLWEHGTTTGNRYAFITKIDYNTTIANKTYIEVYCGTDYAVLNETIVASSVYFSRIKAPFGFPLNPDKWTIKVTDTADRTFNTPTAGTWNNISQLDTVIPIGVWMVRYNVHLYVTRATNGIAEIAGTFSTTNNSETDNEMTSLSRVRATTDGSRVEGNNTVTKIKIFNVTSSTTYRFNIKATQSSTTAIGLIGSAAGGHASVITATIAYL
jgi:hypothetical protein